LTCARWITGKGRGEGHVLWGEKREKGSTRSTTTEKKEINNKTNTYGGRKKKKEKIVPFWGEDPCGDRHVEFPQTAKA